MDIEHNLFYNENTVHSGDFLENHMWFGKETMRKTIKVNITDDKRGGRIERKRSLCCILYMSILLLNILLCGCTRREQLVLEDIRAEQEQGSDLLSIQEQSESGEQVLPEESAGRQSSEYSVPEDGGDPDEPGTIFVHVCGAVEKPDVYELPAGSRVYEAVQAAGGFAEDADENYVNQAQELSDGVKLVIPTLEQTEALVSEGEGEMMAGAVGIQDSVGRQEESTQSGISDDKIDINTASEAELCNVPGIGAVRAAAIIAYRQENGGFSSVEDIMNVNGIKEGTFEKIKDSIKVK